MKIDHVTRVPHCSILLDNMPPLLLVSCEELQCRGGLEVTLVVLRDQQLRLEQDLQHLQQGILQTGRNTHLTHWPLGVLNEILD